MPRHNPIHAIFQSDLLRVIDYRRIGRLLVRRLCCLSALSAALARLSPQRCAVRAATYEYWNKGAQTLKDKISCHEILAVKDNIRIAHWQSRFTVNRIGQTPRAGLSVLGRVR
jgi:hypothetical protein